MTAYGWGHKLLAEGLNRGESAVRRTPGFGEFFPTDELWVAQIADGGDPDDGPSRYARAVRFAAREAVQSARDRGWRPGRRVGLLHGIVLGDVDSWSAFHRSRGEGLDRRGYIGLMPSTVMTEMMREFDFHGPCMAVTAMCASGVAGLLSAKMWIDAGLVDDVVVIASDLSITPENVRAFCDLKVLVADRPALDACRPFQKGSRGFSAGEATVAMIVSGRADGSYGQLLGGAMSHDGYHVTSIAPQHPNVIRCFADALENAGVNPSEVAYLNAHGPGTRQCDRVEAHIFDEMFPDAQGIFSVKPLAGHCQAAAGAVETLASLYSFESGKIPAPPQVAEGHPRLLDGLTPRQEGPMVKSSLGMGGHNAVMVIDAPAG